MKQLLYLGDSNLHSIPTFMSGLNRKTIILGITGGIACGKSETGRILEELGFTVCDADRVAHQLMDKGCPVYHQVVEHFGVEILEDDGAISRPKLGKLVFDDPPKLEQLNGLVHPAVRNELEQWIRKQRLVEQPSAVLLPLLFESGMENLDWDAIVCISSPEAEVFQRLEKRGLSPEEAEKRINSQMLLSEKERQADRVVPNIGTLGELQLAVEKTITAIMLER